MANVEIKDRSSMASDLNSDSSSRKLFEHDKFDEVDEIVDFNEDIEEEAVLSTTRDMSFFMKGKAKQIDDIEPVPVVVSKRFTDDEGKIIPFLIKPIPSKRIDQIQDECTMPIKKKGRIIDEKVDYTRFAARIGVESTVFPNFKSKQLLQDYGLHDPVELAKKILEVGGEYAEWVQAVQRVNGFDEDFEELVNKAKN